MQGPCSPATPWMLGNWSSNTYAFPGGLLRDPVGGAIRATNSSECTGKTGSQLTSCQNTYNPVQESVGWNVCSESELNQGSNPAYSSYNSICNPNSGSSASYNSSNTQPWQFIFVNFLPTQSYQNANAFSTGALVQLTSGSAPTTLFPCGQTVGTRMGRRRQHRRNELFHRPFLRPECEHDAAAGLLLHRVDDLRSRARRKRFRLLLEPDGPVRPRAAAGAVGTRPRGLRNAARDVECASQGQGLARGRPARQARRGRRRRVDGGGIRPGRAAGDRAHPRRHADRRDLPRPGRTRKRGRAGRAPRPDQSGGVRLGRAGEF